MKTMKINYEDGSKSSQSDTHLSKILTVVLMKELVQKYNNLIFVASFLCRELFKLLFYKKYN